ncbi:XAC2610-related protein [Galbibacter mesophilus]|uniref:XAC2610-related protein n=1 Tax=Galbibacter mesophilus TaxID=379069 RepID=UPI001A91436F|nr:hypothetical protein [Galbibacter mesophilus]MCM5664227.1 hypothetical protein [Galbibacter mesophilus]
MKKYSFVLVFIIAAIACKNDDDKKTTLTTAADSLKLQQKKEIVLTDEELIKNLLRTKNNALTTSDSVFYKAHIKRPLDSGFVAVNLYGKEKQQNGLSEFKSTAIIKNGKTITSRIEGSVFRIDKTGEKQYKIYTHDASNNSFSAFDINFNESPTSIRKATRTANFYFDLLPKKKFQYEIKDKEKFFTIRKDRLVNNDSLLNRISNGASIYKSNGLLDLQDATALNTFYFVDSTSVLEKLIIKDNSKILTNITLSGFKKDSSKITHFKSAFVNDSIFKTFEISEAQTKNSKHVVEYQTDSVVHWFTYNKHFQFKPTASDRFSFRKTYPQYYPNLIDSTFYVYSKPFEINKTNAQWRYAVRYTRKTNADPTNVEVSVSERMLTAVKDSSIIFEAPLSPIKKPFNIGELSDQEYKVQNFDINFDGHTDLPFPEGYDLNRNATYAAYVYNPKIKTYLKNDVFTGPSLAKHVLIDKDNRSVIYTASTGNNNYSVRILKMGDNGTILHKETYWSTNNDDKIEIHYQKTKNNAVVEKIDNVAKDKNWDPSDFKNQFLKWIKERISK